MSPSGDCPNSDRLRSLIDGQLSEAEQAELQQHIDECEQCQQTLEGLVAGKESWDGIARRLGGESPVTPALQNVMADAIVVGQTALDGTAQSAKLPPNFLQPSEQTDSMGRLDHYEVLQEVGSGGMGIVLKAFDTSLRRVVAIKVMAPQWAANSAARRRFVREAQAAAAVVHEHVVAIHSVADQHEPPYLAMQFIDGKTLQQRLDESGPLSVREVLRIGMQTAAGLAAAHAQGLVHRDIKPANILLENGVERVKLTDFGLARAVDDASVTQSGVIAGTPLFMSPEQARGEAVDPRSDLFSLGSVLYAMCVGHAPFRASTTMGVIKRVCDDAPRPIREVNADVPDWLSDIIAKLLAKAPVDRFQTAEAVADLLGQFLAHVQQPAVVARPVGVTIAVEKEPVGSKGTTSSGERVPFLFSPWSALWLAAFLFLPIVGWTLLDRRVSTHDFTITTGIAVFVWLGLIAVGAFINSLRRSAAEAGSPLADLAPGWRIRCTKCHRSKPLGEVGGIRLGARSRGKWTLAWCSQCRGLRWAAIEREAAGSEPQAMAAKSPDLAKPVVQRRWWKFALIAAALALCAWRFGTMLTLIARNEGRIVVELRDIDSKLLLRRNGMIVAEHHHGRTKNESSASSSAGSATMIDAIGGATFDVTPGTYDVEIIPPPGRMVDRVWYHRLQLELDNSEIPLTNSSLSIGRGDHVKLTASFKDRPTENDPLPESWPVQPLAKTDGQTPAASAIVGLSEVMRFEGHQTWVGDFDISADGTLLATGSGVPEAMVFVWNMESGRIHRRLKGHTASIHALRFSPDSQRVVSADKDGAMILWDVAKEQELRRFEGHNCRIQTLAWSSDGRLIASGSANWKTTGGVVEIRVWNAETGELVRAIPMPTDERGKGTVLSLRFFPDSKRLLANCEMPAHGVQILDIETGAVGQRLTGGHSKVQSATLSADARFVVTGRQATRVRNGVWDDPDNAVVSLWDLQADKPKTEDQPLSGRLLRELRGHRSGVMAVSFSPDGRLLASCSGGQFLNDPNVPTGGADHSIRLWDVASGRELLRHDHPRWLSRLAFTPDGRHLVTNASGGDRPDDTQLWRIPDRIIDRPEAVVAPHVVLKEERRLEGHSQNITGLAFLSQSRAVSTSGDKTLRLWNVDFGEQLRIWEDRQGGAPLSLAVSAEERLAATGGHDGAINIWSLDAEQQFRQFSAHTKPIYDLTFTPNGQQLLSVSADETVRVWDVGMAEEVRRIESLKGPRCVAVSPDGRWVVVGCYSWHVAIFNLETAALAKELKAVGGAVLDVTFSPDGRQVAAGTQDGHVVIWDVEQESIVARLLGHDDDVGSVAFTPDGRFIVSGGDLGVGDKTIRLREVSTGREVARIAADKQILNRFALSPDGRQLLTGGGEFYRDEKWHADGDHAIRLWQLPELKNTTATESQTYSSDGESPRKDR